jgi:Thiamine pyrophosphate enzyme, central domain
MFAPVVKRAMTADDPRSVAADVQAAAELALAPPTGPVYLGIPTDFLPARAPSANGSRSDAQFRPPGEPLIEAAVDLLADARAPRICAGGGALEAGAGPAVAALAERLAAPVVMTYAAKGLLPPGHPCAAPATLHAPEVGALWDEADLVIAIGTDFDGLTTQNWAMPNPARLLVINVDEQDGAKNYAPDLTLVGDAAKVTALLSERIPGPSDLEPIRAPGASAGGVARCDRRRRARRPVVPRCDGGARSRRREPGRGHVHSRVLARRLSPRGPTAGVRISDVGHARIRAAGLGRRRRRRPSDGLRLRRRRLPVRLRRARNPGAGAASGDRDRHRRRRLRNAAIRSGRSRSGSIWRRSANPRLRGVGAVVRPPGLSPRRVRRDLPETPGRVPSTEGPSVLVVQARLRPPPNTSPRWYRRDRGEPSPARSGGEP